MLGFANCTGVQLAYFTITLFMYTIFHYYGKLLKNQYNNTHFLFLYCLLQHLAVSCFGLLSEIVAFFGYTQCFQ